MSEPLTTPTTVELLKTLGPVGALLVLAAQYGFRELIQARKDDREMIKTIITNLTATIDKNTAALESLRDHCFAQRNGDRNNANRETGK